MADRTNQTQQQLRSAQNADRLHDWPTSAGECSEQSWQVYASNQGYRAFDDWLPGDLFDLARLSRMQVDAIDLQNRLDDEGYIVKGGKSGITLIENPVGRALGTLNGTINSLARRLGLTGMSVADKRSRANRRQQEAGYRSKTDSEKDGAALLDNPYDRSSLM